METSLDNVFITGTFLLISVATMAVNLLTITAIVRTPHLRHSGQWQATLYVFSLAVADILAGFPSVWFGGLYVTETRAMMDDSYTLCLSGAIVTICVVACTNISLLAIAVDRLMYIVYPYFYQRFISERLVKTVILVIWVVSIATGCFVAPHFNNFEVYRCKPLTIFLSHDLKIFFIIFLVIQLLTAGACYVRIAFVARSQQRRIQVTKVQPLNKIVPDVKNLPGSSCRTSDKDAWFTRLAPPEKTEDVVLQPEVSSTVRALEAGTLLDIPKGQPVAEVMMCPVNCSQSNTIVDIAIPRIGDNGRSDEATTNVSSQNQTGNSVSIFTFVAINMLFVFSWMPFVIFSIFFDRGLYNDDKISSLILLPICLNSVVNFVVYAWKNIEYRNAYRKVFTDFGTFMRTKCLVSIF